MLPPVSSTSFMAISRRWYGRFFSEDVLQKLVPHRHLGVHLLQPAILFRHRLHLGHQRRVHAVELRAPVVVSRRADPVHAAQIRYRRAVLALLQNRQDLSIRKSRFLNRLLLAYPSPEKSIFQPNDFPGGLPFLHDSKSIDDPTIVPARLIGEIAVWLMEDDSGLPVHDQEFKLSKFRRRADVSNADRRIRIWLILDRRRLREAARRDCCGHQRQNADRFSIEHH
jgi:hypothetical protein